LRPNGKLWRGGNVEENVGKTWEKVKMREKKINWDTLRE
jgi:hypothetical protein